MGYKLLYLFEDYGLDTDRRELYRATTPISVEPKVFDLLMYVIRNRERVVSKDDLIAAIWHGRIVSESALTTCINAARNAIGDSGEAQRLIKTLPRRGIRFVGVVREEQKSTAALVDAAPGPSRPSIAVADKPSIAVLPFANISGDPEQEYFSDGITEDIITDLSKIFGLKVVSRNTVFTFKGKAIDIGEIANRLKVGHVVEGSVRKAAGRVRITAELIDAGNDRHVWAERYDRELTDIFALQDEISQAIVAALKIKLLPEEKKAIETRSADSLEAYELYLQGRHFALQYSARDLQIALRFYRRALELDSNYARAWAGLANCETFLYRRGRSDEPGLAAAEKALSLDPSLAEAYASKAYAMAELGRYEEAIAENEEALRLEPNSFDTQHAFAMTCFQLGRYEDAIAHFERAALILETDFAALGLVATSYEALGRHGDANSAARRALERIQREIALRPDNAFALSWGAIQSARLGETRRAKAWASHAMAIENEDALYDLAAAMAKLNEPDQALEMLEACQPKRSPEFVNWMKKDADFMALREHPRFRALIARGEERLATAQTKRARAATTKRSK